MVYSGQSLFKWHADNRIFPNEKLSPYDARRVGYFVEHNGDWWLVNENLPDMADAVNKSPIPVGSKVKLVEGAQIVLQKGEGGRVIAVQMAGN